MVRSVDELMADLDKMHGKSETVKIVDDDGNEKEYEIFQLPTQNLNLLLKLQAFQKKARKLGSEEIDLSALSSDEIEQYANLMKELVVKTIAYSVSPDKSDKDLAKKIESKVDGFAIPYLEKFSEAIMKVNSVESGKKKEAMNK